MSTLESFKQEYETDPADLTIRGRKFHFLVPRSIDGFLDHEDPLRDFPLWSKIWEASVVLADYLAGLEPDPQREMLEIGCGVGVSGIVAAAFGHRVTLTESNRHALNFVRANAEINLPESASFPGILMLDWNRPKIEGAFDVILGSEVVYKEADFAPLLGLFRRYLKPNGLVILAEGLRSTSLSFFRQMALHFDIEARKKVLRSAEKETRVLLCTMAPKKPH